MTTGATLPPPTVVINDGVSTRAVSLSPTKPRPTVEIAPRTFSRTAWLSTVSPVKPPAASGSARMARSMSVSMSATQPVTPLPDKRLRKPKIMGPPEPITSRKSFPPVIAKLATSPTRSNAQGSRTQASPSHKMATRSKQISVEDPFEEQDDATTAPQTPVETATDEVIPSSHPSEDYSPPSEAMAEFPSQHLLSERPEASSQRTPSLPPASGASHPSISAINRPSAPWPRGRPRKIQSSRPSVERLWENGKPTELARNAILDQPLPPSIVPRSSMAEVRQESMDRSFLESAQQQPTPTYPPPIGVRGGRATPDVDERQGGTISGPSRAPNGDPFIHYRNGLHPPADHRRRSGPPEDRRTPVPLDLVPEGVMQAFAARLPFLQQRAPNGLSELYDMYGTFWVPQRSNFFLLMQMPMTNVNSDASGTIINIHNPTFFFWDPLPLTIGGIKCARFGCGGVLVPVGIASAPRKIVMKEDQGFWVISMDYKCPACSTTWNACDAIILASLPPLLRAEFPGTERGGILYAVEPAVSVPLQLNPPLLSGRVRRPNPPGDASISPAPPDGRLPVPARPFIPSPTPEAASSSRAPSAGPRRSSQRPSDPRRKLRTPAPQLAPPEPPRPAASVRRAVTPSSKPAQVPSAPSISNPPVEPPVVAQQPPPVVVVPPQPVLVAEEPRPLTPEAPMDVDPKVSQAVEEPAPAPTPAPQPTTNPIAEAQLPTIDPSAPTTPSTSDVISAAPPLPVRTSSDGPPQAIITPGLALPTMWHQYHGFMAAPSQPMRTPSASPAPTPSRPPNLPSSSQLSQTSPGHISVSVKKRAMPAEFSSADVPRLVPHPPQGHAQQPFFAPFTYGPPHGGTPPPVLLHPHHPPQSAASPSSQPLPQVAPPLSLPQVAPPPPHHLSTQPQPEVQPFAPVPVTETPPRQETPAVSKKPRAPKKCSKCLSPDCPGRGGLKWCKSPCAGCKRVECDANHKGGSNACIVLLKAIERIEETLPQSQGAADPDIEAVTETAQKTSTSEPDAEGEVEKEIAVEPETPIFETPIPAPAVQQPLEPHVPDPVVQQPIANSAAPEPTNSGPSI